MKVAIACDHGGFPLKQDLIGVIKSMGHEIVDLGAHQYDKDDDYPDFARYLGQAIQHGQADRGVLLCGSGVGASVAANKLTGVRAAICHDSYSAHQGVEHDDMNVLCMGARIVGAALANELVRAFLSANFSQEDRHVRRLEKVIGMEAGG
ncbi:Putative sugar phosphate isomerase YwlF [Poriferisphaera corsica]|uniref:Sugar phosphate isomerase YwlF n=1 Tax=Poriferisphaera corsica TaxID=2528020 RepID=A0A517YXA6_9BACT|nr:ribose 5-phosphate isomerase B [Poriferisphaera corsica]QDU34851.1 Putative sugar phosphate isomerase YwlF [Poriferisphaera corsica]